jgi:hypothetical protein
MWTHTQAHPKCLSHLTVKFAKMYLALEKLSEDCGLTGGTLCYWWSDIDAAYKLASRGGIEKGWAALLARH